MGSDTPDLLTAANIAKALGVSDAKVKKAIQTLGIKPQAKKGVCSYYGKDTVAEGERRAQVAVDYDGEQEAGYHQDTVCRIEASSRIC